MSLTEKDVRHVARLARIALTPEESERYLRQLGQILHYVERLQKLDVEGVPPTSHAIPLAAPLRPDEVRPSLDRDAALASAPQRVGEGFAVPRVIE